MIEWLVDWLNKWILACKRTLIGTTYSGYHIKDDNRYLTQAKSDMKPSQTCTVQYIFIVGIRQDELVRYVMPWSSLTIRSCSNQNQTRNVIFCSAWENMNLSVCVVSHARREQSYACTYAKYKNLSIYLILSLSFSLLFHNCLQYVFSLPDRKSVV